LIVADSDVLIDFLRGGGDELDTVRVELAAGRLATTAITAFELEAGARTEKHRFAVADLLAGMPTLPLTASAARLGGAIHRERLLRGQQIGMADALIAAICIDEGRALLTRNRRHFEEVDGLSIVGESRRRKGTAPHRR
jgi:predicted nucleic acid-binding protein